MSIRPLRDLVLIRPIPPPPLSAFLYTPDRQELARRGVVEALGPECRRGTQIGDTVVVHALVGVEVGKDLVLLAESDILATDA